MAEKLLKTEEKIAWKDARHVFAWYWKISKNHQYLFWWMMALWGVGTLLADVLSVVVYKNIIDIITSSQNVEQLWHNFILLVILYITYFTLFRIGDKCLRLYQVGTLRDLTNFTFQKIQQHSYDFFANNFSGSLTSQARRFVDGFATIVEGIILTYWLSLIRLIGVVLVVAFFSWQLSIVFCLFLGGIFFVIRPLLKERMRQDTYEAAASSKVSGYFADVFSNVFNVKIFSAHKKEKKAFAKLVEDQVLIEDTSWRVWNKLVVLQNSMMLTFQLTLLGGGLFLWSKGQITAGTIVLVFSYAQGLFMTAWHLVRTTTGVLKALANAKEMVDIFELEPSIQDGKNATELCLDKGQIEFSQINFGYADGQLVFDNFSLSVKSGEKVGLVGPSGGGKSTITKLLLRFMDPTAGAISIDDQDIRTVTQDSLRRAIAYVPQEPLLFHRTLRENIAYGKPDATEEEIIEAAKKAHAHEFIEVLGAQYETMVGERGIKLSGGQRQRIAIARAILKDAPILVLDEATSALDSISELKIREAVDELIENKTALIIAHRLSTVEKMDRIIVLSKDGAIEEEGSHQELITRGGLYSTLWNHQTGGFLPEDEDTEIENREKAEG